MGLIDDCLQCFGAETFYDVLGVDKSASGAEVKTAYRKASLLLHPDKVTESKKEDSTKKFQVLSKVYCILSDTEKRAFYDETGTVDGEDTLGDGSENYWKEFWRALFPKLEKEDIVNFYASYRGSDEEVTDLKECYIKCEGDMDLISEYFIGYQVEEEDRLRTILNDAIKKEEISSFPKFVNEKPSKKLARVKRYKKEAAEVAAMQDESLVRAIAKRAKERESSFDSMIANIEAKYGAKQSKGKKKQKT